MFIVKPRPSTSQLLEDILLIIGQASEILRLEYQNYCAGKGFIVEHKSDKSPVTQADYRVNEYIIEQLRQISELPILSEEIQQTQEKKWNKFWLLDPLDGTKEFLHQRPEFTINLSIVENGQTIFAVLAIPCEFTVYIAPESGAPLKYNYQNKEWASFIDISERNSSQVTVGLSQSSQQKPQYEEFLNKLEQVAKFKTYKAGSAYKFCMMLEDKIDLYPRFHPTCEWDTSAGQCLLERVNGGLVGLKGEPFYYNQRNTFLNHGFIAYRNIEMKHLAFNVLELMS